MNWHDKDFDIAKAVLANCDARHLSAEALPALSRRLGRPITLSALRGAFARKPLPSPSLFCRGEEHCVDGSRHESARAETSTNDEVSVEVDISELDYDDETDTQPQVQAFGRRTTMPAPSAARVAELGADAMRLVRLVQDRACTLEEACDELDASPRRCRDLQAAAKEAGYAIEFFHDELHWKLPEPTESLQDTGVAPPVGERFEVAVISDLHFGSKHCGRAQLFDFLSYVRSRGIQHVLDPGDNLDGIYRFSLYEQSHRGFDEQADDAYQLFRQFPDLTIHTIDGNHDDTLSDGCGMQTGRALVERFSSLGLNNLRYYGSRAATLAIGGARVMLWHPRGSGAYALSYKLQKKLESFAPGCKPDVLLTGHFHQACYIVERGVHAFLCPTFQLPGGSFGNSLVGAPSVGGMILGWELTEARTLRRFHVERVSYYANEKSREVA